MPWSCCGAELSDDAHECPSCGKGKARWTVRLDRTRVFNLGPAEWDLEALDYTPEDEASEAELDEDWELERVEALPGDEDQPAELDPSEGPRRKDAVDEEEDWELESVEALPGDSDAGSAADVEARVLSRRGAAPPAVDEDEDEEWELEALEHADAND